MKTFTHFLPQLKMNPAEQQAEDINLLSKRNQSVEIQVVVMMLG